MKTLMAYLVCLWLPVAACAQLGSYKFTGRTAAGIGLNAVAGICVAANHAYRADPHVFEKKGWSGKYWRHNAWENNYPGNDYQEGERVKKPEFLNVFRDVHHGSSAGNYFFTTSAAIVVVIGEKRHWTHYAVDILLSGLARGAASHLTYNYLK